MGGSQQGESPRRRGPGHLGRGRGAGGRVQLLPLWRVEGGEEGEAV